MAIILPEWVSPYMQINEFNEFDVSLSLAGEDKRFFTKKKNELEDYCSTIKEINNLPKEDLKTLVQSYIICNLALGSMESANALNKKKAGENLSGNDGTGRQHWIPECYLKSFAKNGNIRKLPKDFITNSQSNEYLYSNKKFGKLVSIKSTEFCEEENNKGKMYDPYYELFLSKIESDFAFISANRSSHRPVENLWDFIVITTFFFVLNSRTKEMKDTQRYIWNAKHALLLDVIPSVIAGVEVYSFSPKSIIPKDIQKQLGKDMKFPFNQHPMWSYVEQDGKVSLWCIYKPDSLLWLRNKESKDPVKNSELFYSLKILSILGDNDTKALYFHPDHTIWRVKLVGEN